MQRDISEQHTVPLPLSTANAFHAYLAQHRLLWVEVARASGVQSLTVWSIDHGLAIDPIQALRIRQGLYKLTGIPYTGPIHTTKEQREGQNG